MVVVVEFGVPLKSYINSIRVPVQTITHGASDGVTGSLGGGGRLIRVGV